MKQTKVEARPTNSTPLVSVAVATCNGVETLQRALESVVLQDYPCLDIIICDDGSTDGSRAICQEYSKRYTNIRYVENEENLGIIENYKKLFRLGKGKYFLWADQDDVRESSFISKCAAVLESDENAVLCHSHTGVFWKTFNNLMHINTINSVDNESGVLRRYWRFLRRYSDTAIYGLIRSDALRKTGICRTGIWSANSLMFELLLIGKFRQIPETLYFYSAKGVRHRPTPEEEYFRANGGRSMPKYQKPFLVLAYHQTKAILGSSHGLLWKCLLLMTLWIHVTMVNAVKAIFRLLESGFGKHVPKWFGKFCMFAVLDMRDIHFIGRSEENRDYLPDLWLLRKPDVFLRRKD